MTHRNSFSRLKLLVKTKYTPHRLTSFCVNPDSHNMRSSKKMAKIEPFKQGYYHSLGRLEVDTLTQLVQSFEKLSQTLQVLLTLFSGIWIVYICFPSIVIIFI